MNFLGIVYKNILRRKARTFLSLLGIMIGVAAIVTLVGISNGLRSNALDVMSTLTGDITVTKSGNILATETMDESVMDKIKDISIVYGMFDIVVAVDAHSLGDLERIVLEIRKIPYVSSTTTLVSARA